MPEITKYKWLGPGVLKISNGHFVGENEFLPSDYDKDKRNTWLKRKQLVKVTIDVELNQEVIEAKNITVKETIVSLYGLIKDKFAKNKKTKKEFEAKAKELMLKAEALEKETKELKERIKETKAGKEEKEGSESSGDGTPETSGLATKQNLGESS